MSTKTSSQIDSRTDALTPVCPAGLSDEHGTELPTVMGIRRVVYLALAGLFFGLGMLGIALPGLPTTPFLLLTSYFLVRTSPSLNQRMLRSRLVGSLLHDWQVHRGIRPHVKTRAVLLVLVVAGCTAWVGHLPPVVLLPVISLTLVGIVIITRLPTITD